MLRGAGSWMLAAVFLLGAGSVQADFVDDMETGDPPVRWSPDNSIISAETSNVYDGNQSLRVENLGGQIVGAAYSTGGDPKYFPVTGGAEYTFTYAYYGIGTAVYHGVYVFNTDGAQVWGTADFGWTNNAWDTYTYTATMPADADYGYMGLFPVGEGTTAIFDNISFVPEPASMILLGLGGVACLRRRRR